MAKKEKPVEDLNPTGLVYYTDGGARWGPKGSNPGYAGYGIHGYSYNYGEIKKGIGLSGVITTETGYSTKSGDKAQVKPLHYVDGYGTLEGFQSNNAAEIQAATMALAHAKEYRLDHQDVKQINIITDSRGVVDAGNQWLSKWKSNNWIKSDGTPVKGQEWWKLLSSELDNHKSNGVQVNFVWVKGHSGEVGNEQADQLATLAVTKNKEGDRGHTIKETPLEKYWSETYQKHPLITQRAMYFVTDGATLKPGCYYLGNHGKDDDMIGTRIPDGYYSYVELAETEPIMEILIKRQMELTCPEIRIIVVNLVKLLSQNVASKVVQYGPQCFLKDNPRRYDLVFLDDERIAKEMDPPIQAWQAVEALNIVKTIFNSIQTSDPAYILYDITPRLYAQNEKNKTVLKPEFGTGYCEMKVDIEPPQGFDAKPIKLIFGVDLPARNSLKRMEDLEPSVKLVVWIEGAGIVRFATYVETKTGKGLFVSYYSNRVVLKPTAQAK
jgi:ribonuclease HI